MATDRRRRAFRKIAVSAVPVLRQNSYSDPETGQARLNRHGVREEEAEDVLQAPLEDRPGHDGARVAIGQSRAGRYLRVVYVPDPEPDSLFCIAAFDLSPRALPALRRRRPKKL